MERFKNAFGPTHTSTAIKRQQQLNVQSNVEAFMRGSLIEIVK